jgi:hypothetical protein
MNLHNKLTLQSKLSIIFAVFATALVVSLGLHVRNIGSDTIAASVETQLGQAAEQMAGRLDLQMSERLNDIALAAATPGVFTSGDVGVQREYLTKLQATNPTYAWIGFAGPDGIIKAATGGLLEGADGSERPWFARGSVQPSAIDVHDAKLLQKLLAPAGAEPLRFVDVTAPVHDGSGNLVGVLSGHLSWSWAAEVGRDVLSTIPDLKNSELLILSSSGIVLLGPRDLVGRPLDAISSTDYVQQIAQTHGHNDYEGLGWMVLVRQPVADALAPIVDLDNAIFFSGLLLLAFAILAGRWIAHHITRPLSDIARDAEIARAGGEIKGPALRGSCREIDSLSETLSGTFSNLRRIQAELEETNSSLEERVRQRTLQAEQAACAKGEFLATMSHEIRSPTSSSTRRTCRPKSSVASD